MKPPSKCPNASTTCSHTASITESDSDSLVDSNIAPLEVNAIDIQSFSCNPLAIPTDISIEDYGGEHENEDENSNFDRDNPATAENPPNDAEVQQVSVLQQVP